MTEPTHGRLPWPTRDELDDERRVVYDAIVGGPRAADATTSPIATVDGRLEGPFNAMLVSPAVGGALQTLGSAIRYATTFADRDRELAILQIAAHHRSQFEWFAHERVARGAGLDEATLGALRAGERPTELSASAAAVWGAVDAILAHGDLDDEQYARLEDALGQVTAVELVVLVGYYQALALLLRTFRIPVPEAVRGSFTDWSQSDREGKV